jgi:hypothetical protein
MVVVVAATERRRASREGKKHVSLSRRGRRTGPSFPTRNAPRILPFLAVEYGMVNECHFTLLSPAFRYCHYCCYCCDLTTSLQIQGVVCVFVAVPRSWFLELVSDDDKISTRIRVHVPMRCKVVLTFSGSLAGMIPIRRRAAVL